MQVQRKLLIACILCFVFMAVEVVGGYLAGRYRSLRDLRTCQCQFFLLPAPRDSSSTTGAHTSL